MAANPSLVGRIGGNSNGDGGGGGIASVEASGFKAMRTEMQLASRVLSDGLLSGVAELATGGGKVRAVWESIKWGALARAGLAGFAGLLIGARALAGGIRKAVDESAALQVAMERLATTKILGKQFEVFLGGVDAAKKRVAELYEFVANSKFNFTEAANASRTLTIMSNGALGSGQHLKMLGKISSATGVQIEDLAGTVAELNKQVRNKEDIDGSLQALQRMGVISEATAKRLEHLSQTGAPPADVWTEVNAAIEHTSTSVGDTEKTVGELEETAAKAKDTMMAAFAVDFVAAHRREVELTGQAYQNMTPAMASVGKLLAVLTAPAETLKTQLKEVTASKGFANLAKDAMNFATILPVVMAGMGIVSGGSKLAKSTGKAYARGGMAEIGDLIKGAVSPAAEAARLAKMATGFGERKSGFLKAAGAAGTTAEQAADLKKQAAAMGMLESVTTGGAKGMTLFSKAASGVGSAMGKVMGVLMRAVPIILIVTGITLILTKVWEKLEDVWARQDHVKAMMSGMASSNDAIREQIKNLKNLDDHLKLVTDSRIKLNDALIEQDKVGADVGATDEEKSAAAANVANARRNLHIAEGADTSRLAAGTVQIEQAEKRLRIEKEIGEMAFNAELQQASAAKQILMLKQRQLEMAKIRVDYEKGIEGQPAIAAARSAVAAADDLQQKRIAEAEKGVEDAQKNAPSKLAQTAGAIQLAPANYLSRSLGLGPLVEFGKETEAITSAKAKVSELKAGPGAEQLKAQQDLQKALSDSGSMADKMQAASMEAKKKGDYKTSEGLDLEVAKRRLTEPEEAAAKEQDAKNQIAIIKRQGATKQADLDMANKIVGVTTESYQAEDQIAQIKKDRIERERQLLVDVSEKRANTAEDPEVKKQRDLQIQSYDEQKTEIDKETAERSRQLGREKTAWQSAINAHSKNAEAIMAATKGNFAQAEAAIKSARSIEDNQAQADRAFELRQQGVAESEIPGRVQAEQKQREQDRGAQAEAYRYTEGRSLQERELKLGERGFGTGLHGEEARKARIGMEDQDAYRAKVAEGIAANLGTDEAAAFAKRSVTADILGKVPTPGTGQVADSLTKVGGGGGLYAGPSGDPQLEAQKRIAALAQTQLTVLQSIDKKISLGVSQ